MKMRIISLSGEIPKYETEGASGMDLRAYLSEPVTIEPMTIKLIPTGICVEIPAGYEGQVRARSGLALKHGITLINSVGTIDSDYRGEISVPLINLGSEAFTVNNGDRIAQLIISKYERVDISVVDELDESDRGSGGFGHTGIND